MRGVVTLLLLAACGRIGFDDLAGVPGGDAGGDGSMVAAWQAVATSANWTCGIAADQTLWCWGNVPSNPLGTRLQYPAEQVPGSWSAVSVAGYGFGGDHACGIQTDGTLWCWGDNYAGALGNNTTVPSPMPVRVNAATWRAVAAGYGFSCGIQTDDSLWCWGDNNAGKLGINSTTEAHTPQQLPGTWSAITAGHDVACAIDTVGMAWCWGDNTYGQLGNGTMAGATGPVGVTGTWTAIAASHAHTCALATDGVAWCWGQNDYGQLGTGNTTSSTVPVSTGRALTSITIGEFHSCGLDAAGALWGWGNGDHGALGAPVSSSVPMQLTSAAQVSAGDDVTCIVDGAGALQCTGRNSFGQLGAPPGEVHVPTRADTRTDWRPYLVAGGTHACAMAPGVPAMCWGLNNEGEVGDGTSRDRQDPALVQGGGDYTIIGAGPHSTMGIRGDTTGWLWGCDWVAQTNNPNAEQVGSGAWSALAIGDEHTCDLEGGTALVCRGDNTYGQLGNGSTTASPGATVPGTWLTVAAGINTTCGTQSSGTGYCWGQGNRGQLGSGVIGNLTTPQPVATGPLHRISVGELFACAIDQTNKLWCWGDDTFGQLADNLAAPNGRSPTPVQVGTRSDWSQLATGGRHACAIPNDGTLWCWGQTAYGETGHAALVGTSTDDVVPYQVGTDTDWSRVAAGADFTCALKTDGTRWCWGADFDGQLGNGLAWRVGFAPVAF